MKKSLVLLLPLLLLPGCSNDAATDQSGGDGSAAASSTSAPDTAEATVRQLFDGLQKGQPIALWNALPASYQSDTNSLVQAFGQKMDPQLWKGITDILNTVHQLLVDKHDFIVNHPNITSSADPEAAKAAVGQTTSLLKTILDAAGDLEKLKTFDGAQFMESTGANLAQQIDSISRVGATLNPASASGPIGLAMFRDVKIETVESSDTTATLKMTAADGTEKTEEFVKVEGKWLPADMAAEWDQLIAGAKDGLEQLTNQEQLAQSRMGVTMVTGVVTGMLTPLQNATTQEEFNAAIEQVLQSGMGMMMGLGGGPPPASAFEAPPAQESPGLNPQSVPAEPAAAE